MGIGDVAIHLFSPAKLVYLAYIVLAVLRGVFTSKCEFFVVSVLFIAVQIGHDDYLRIRLNARARKKEGMPPERP